MSYHPGTCIYLPGFDYTKAAAIPVQTVRKMDMLTTHSPDNRFGYLEGEKVQKLKDAGKRVIGTIAVPNLEMWSMSEDEWRGYMSRYMANVPTKVVELGNEPGKAVIPSYFEKLKIASDMFRAVGRRILMAAPYPGAEAAFIEGAMQRGAWDWVDGVCLHPYGRTPADCLAKVERIRGQLTTADYKRGLHLTEFGWGTEGGHATLSVSEQQQALNVQSVFALWKQNAERLRLGNCLYYTYNDWDPTPVGPIKWLHRCGVLRLDGSAKPSLAALQAAA